VQREFTVRTDLGAEWNVPTALRTLDVFSRFDRPVFRHAVSLDTRLAGLK